MARYKKIKIITDACCKIENAHLKGRIGKGKSACGMIILDEEENIILEKSKYLGELTVPQAEYNGLIFALDLASGYCRNDIEVWMDSELVIKQMNGDYGIKSENMKPLYDEVKKLEGRFSGFKKYFHHKRNAKWAKYVDALAEAEYNKNHLG